MTSPLDFIEETHDGPEPRVLTVDVQAILKQKVRPGEDDGEQTVQAIAEKARVSTRTVYRVLSADKETIGIHLADALCIAAGAHLSACRLMWPDGEVTPYF